MSETDVAVPPGPTRDVGATASWRRWLEPAVAAVGFLSLCIVVVSRHSAMLEPDDFAYQASIVALSHGEVLLSHVQYLALQNELSTRGLGQILQWHHVASGYWISEKNPGYPFLAEPFYLLGVLRLAPLFYGALGAISLYLGARAWIGRWAGALSVWLFVASGAAMVFAWRSTMPSFTGASLVATGAGLLVWTLLRRDVASRRRALVGLLAFLALEVATFVRYTNIVELAVAALAVLLVARRCTISWRVTWLWLASVAAFGLGVAAFNLWAYGSVSSTGYSAGEITFSISAIWPNLRLMPAQLARTMPDWLIAFATLIWVLWRAWRARHLAERAGAQRDLLVAGTLALAWLGLWLVYFAYTWTLHAGVGARPGAGAIGIAAGAAGAYHAIAAPGHASDTVHIIRFYLPALGPVALLAAWALRRLGAALGGGAIVILGVMAVISFHSMASAGGVPIGPGVGHFPGPPGSLRPGGGVLPTPRSGSPGP